MMAWLSSSIRSMRGSISLARKAGNRLVVCVAQAEGDKSILQLAELLVVAYQVLYFLGIAVMALFNHPERCAQVLVDGGELRFNACDGLRRARER